MSLSVTVTARCDGCGSKISATGHTRGEAWPFETVEIRVAQRGWFELPGDRFSCELCQAYKRKKLRIKPTATHEEVPCRSTEHRIAGARS